MIDTPYTHMTFLKYSIYLFAFCYACKNDKTVRIQRDGEIAEGNISIDKDTIFNGLIRFYDSADNKLSREAFYINDTLHGERKDYHSNGQIASIVFYNMGNENGLTSFFDSSGRLFQTHYYFHGLQVGPLITYSSESPVKYSFYSFDGYRLFMLDYDSSMEKTIESWRNKLFFFNENYVVDDYNPKNVKRQFFVYLPNPPDYNFAYSFCIVDSSGQITRTLKNFSLSEAWTQYVADPQEKKENESFAFNLQVNRAGKIIFSDIRKLE